VDVHSNFTITFLLLQYPGLCSVDGRRMNWKGFGSCFGLIEVLSHYLAGGTVETHEKPVRITSSCYIESWNRTAFGNWVTCLLQPLHCNLCDVDELTVCFKVGTHL
jgi:hypothetical protein